MQAACELHCRSLNDAKFAAGRAPSRPYSLDAGAGALLSLGALRSVALEDMEDCVLRQWSTGRRCTPLLT
jgi:hypothetical protein